MASAETHAEHLETPQGVTRDLTERHASSGSMLRGAIVVFGILFVLGIVGFVIKLTGGTGIGSKSEWGYFAGVLAFLFSTAASAPMVAIAPRIAKAHWRRSISRIAELWAVVGALSLAMFIPLLWVLPSLEDGRRSFWFYHPGEVPQYSPHIWSSAAILSFVILGFMLLWMSAWPDLAYLREHGRGLRQRWAARLAPGWIGTTKQWFTQYHRMGIVGAFYFLMLITVHFFITTDFLMTLVPGWIDALYPATFSANSLQAGAATVILTMWFVRYFGGYRNYLTLDQFWGLGKLMFALSLLWVWFWFSSFNIFWYGNKPNEQFVLKLFISGPYVFMFFATFIMVFIIPFWTMIWNPLRKSIWGPPVIAISVLLGTLMDRLRLFVASYSVEGIGDPAVDKIHGIPTVPAAVWPDFADVLIVIGALSGAIFLYLVASRIIPIINIWEQRELLLYKRHKPFHRTEVVVLGKPE